MRLVSQGLADGTDVVILNRTNTIKWYVHKFKAKKLNGFLESIRSFFPMGLKERITISTVHKYKGLEKPMVIVLDAVASSYPLIHPDWAFSRVLGDCPEKIIKEERRLLYVALTRAVEKLVIITDGRSKSPFLEELERRQFPSAINWADYPPARDTTTRLVVKVGNQVRRGVPPTLAIKDVLKATGYQWQPTGWPGWAKIFPAEGFRMETIQAELWAESADGIDVRIYDDTETLTAHFLINASNWNCVFDQFESLCAPKAEPSGAAQA